MDKMAFDLRNIPCVQNGVAETLSHLGDGAIEIPVREVDGQFVNSWNEEKQCGRDGDPDPARQDEALADTLAQVLNLLMQDQRRHTEK
jgi:hypothetical protein